MPITIISDVHGQLFWKDIIRRRDGIVVFLGDYFDRRGDGPYARSQVDNFLEICEYVRNNPETVMLLGNHDIQYLPGSRYGCSERSSAMGNAYKRAMQDNKDLLKMAHVLRFPGATPILFTHAGVSETFMRRHKLENPEDIEGLWQSAPGEFDWQNGSPNGDDVWQSPAWIRPMALLEDALSGYTQVVWHTIVQEIEKAESENGTDIWLTCTLDSQCLRLKDNGEFLEIWPATRNPALDAEGLQPVQGMYGGWY